MSAPLAMLLLSLFSSFLQPASAEDQPCSELLWHEAIRVKHAYDQALSRFKRNGVELVERENQVIEIVPGDATVLNQYAKRVRAVRPAARVVYDARLLTIGEFAGSLGVYSSSPPRICLRPDVFDRDGAFRYETPNHELAHLIVDTAPESFGIFRMAVIRQLGLNPFGIQGFEDVSILDEALTFFLNLRAYLRLEKPQPSAMGYYIRRSKSFLKQALKVTRVFREGRRPLSRALYNPEHDRYHLAGFVPTFWAMQEVSIPLTALPPELREALNAAFQRNDPELKPELAAKLDGWWEAEWPVLEQFLRKLQGLERENKAAGRSIERVRREADAVYAWLLERYPALVLADFYVPPLDERTLSGGERP